MCTDDGLNFDYLSLTFNRTRYHRESNKVLDALVQHGYITRYPQGKIYVHELIRGAATSGLEIPAGELSTGKVGKQTMARIFGSIATSHSPTIGFALEHEKQHDTVWSLIFAAYEPVRRWLAE